MHAVPFGGGFVERDVVHAETFTGKEMHVAERRITPILPRALRAMR